MNTDKTIIGQSIEKYFLSRNIDFDIDVFLLKIEEQFYYEAKIT